MTISERASGTNRGQAEAAQDTHSGQYGGATIEGPITARPGTSTAILEKGPPAYRTRALLAHPDRTDFFSAPRRLTPGSASRVQLGATRRFAENLMGAAPPLEPGLIEPKV